MDLYRFVLGIVLGLYIGFARLNQLRFNRARPGADGHSQSHQACRAIHLLEIPERAAWQCRQTASDDHGGHAGTGLGGPPT